MKQSRWFLSSLTSFMVAGLLTVSPSYAEKGGGSTGGGNTVNLNLIEDYVKAVEDLPGFKEYTQPKISEIQAIIPGFASALKEQANRLTFYVIPKKIETLPEKQTGLHFNSEQPAYQQNGEVFISETLLNQMSVKQKGQLFLHELIEGARFSVNKNEDVGIVVSDTRVVMAYIVSRPRLVGKALAEILESRRFGSYPTQAQLDDFKTWSTAAVQQQITLTCDVSHVADYAQFANQSAEFYCQRFSQAEACRKGGSIPWDMDHWGPFPDENVIAQYGTYNAMVDTYRRFSFGIISVYGMELEARGSKTDASSEAYWLQRACKESQELLSRLKAQM